MRYLRHYRSALRRYSISMLCLLAATILASCGGPKEPRPNIVLITVDTLRADHMSLYGYERQTTPHIDAWFSEGTVYDRAYSATSYTPASIVSILTGLWPRNHHVQQFGQWLGKDLSTLPRALSKRGYQTCAVVSNSVLSSEWMGLHKHFDHYDDRMTERELYRDLYERIGAPTTDAALDWLNTRRDPDKPFFIWVHYNDPHGPYTPPEPKVRDFEHTSPRLIKPNRIPEYQRHPGLSDGEEYVDLYDEEIAYLDQEVGRLLRGLESLPRFAETTVYLTADHGETLLEHEAWFQHGYQTYEELIHVPLAVRGPQFTKARIQVPVSNIDIAPTIYNVLNMGPPRELDGIALSHSPLPRPIFAESHSNPSAGKWSTAILGTEKWMLYQPQPPGTAIQRRYYNLATDPYEKSPQSGDHGAPPAALQEFWNTDPKGLEGKVGERLDAPGAPSQRIHDIEERLRALGYL